MRRCEREKVGRSTSTARALCARLLLLPVPRVRLTPTWSGAGTPMCALSRPPDAPGELVERWRVWRSGGGRSRRFRRSERCMCGEQAPSGAVWGVHERGEERCGRWLRTAQRIATERHRPAALGGSGRDRATRVKGRGRRRRGAERGSADTSRAKGRCVGRAHGERSRCRLPRLRQIAR